MEPLETIQISDTVRVQMYQDTDCSNPLDDWDHGIQFITLPDPSRTWRDYAEPTSNTYGGVKELDPGPLGNYREWWNESWREPWQTQYNAPSFRTWLDTHTAAWLPITRNGYDGTIVRDTDDFERVDAIALVSRAMFREWHGIPEGKPMPRGYRQKAMESLRAVIDEYNKWATGDCYGYVVERLDPDNCNCDTEDTEHEEDCSGWGDADGSGNPLDSCWGFIGYEYAMQEATHAGMLEAGIPIPQVTPDQKGITLIRADGVPNTESPQSRTLYPTKPLPGSHYGVSWIVRTEHRDNTREYKEGYNTYTARTVSPEYIEGTDFVRVRFTHPTMQDSIVMHRLQWQSAQDTMKALAGRS